jgi:transcriptional regulator with XRE-family HTH domain
MWHLAYVRADGDEVPTAAISTDRVVAVDPRAKQQSPRISAEPDGVEVPDRADRPDHAHLTWLPKDPPPRPKAIEQIGRAVLQLRLYRGWRQVDVGTRAGVDQMTVSRLEHGVQKGLSLRKLAAILDALLVGEVQAKPWSRSGPPTELERMLHGDPWRRATERADRRLGRPRRTRTTISTRQPSERRQGETPARTTVPEE